MKNLSIFSNSARTIGVLAGSLTAGFMVVAPVGAQQMTAPTAQNQLSQTRQPSQDPFEVNPYQDSDVGVCPGIYYEEPFSSYVLPPAGCPANDLGAIAPSTEFEGNPAVPDTIPVPEVLQDPIATITPEDGMISLRLVNETNVPISYVIVGTTGDRTLGAGEDVTLSGVPIPVQMTWHRSDDGFVTIEPMVMEDQNLVELTMNEALSYDQSEGGLIIDEAGDVVID